MKIKDTIIMGAFMYGVSIADLAKYFKMKPSEIEDAIRREWKR